MRAEQAFFILYRGRICANKIDLNNTTRPIGFTTDRSKVVLMSVALCLLVTARCGACFMFCPVRRLIVVLSVSCLVLCHLFGEGGASCFAFLWSMACGTVCYALFALHFGVIGRL